MTTWIATAVLWLGLAAALDLGYGMAVTGAVLALVFGAIATRMSERPRQREPDADEEEDWLLFGDY